MNTVGSNRTKILYFYYVRSSHWLHIQPLPGICCFNRSANSGPNNSYSLFPAEHQSSCGNLVKPQTTHGPVEIVDISNNTDQIKNLAFVENF